MDSGGCWQVLVDSGGGLMGPTEFEGYDSSLLWVLGGSYEFRP
jgi:hypothetical protein